MLAFWMITLPEEFLRQNIKSCRVFAPGQTDLQIGSTPRKAGKDIFSGIQEQIQKAKEISSNLMPPARPPASHRANTGLPAHGPGTGDFLVLIMTK